MTFLSFNNYINESAINQFLFEGGAFGHMSHPYDDKNLTMNDIKDMIISSLSGGLDKEVIPTEKLDGQAIAVSWKDGKLVSARNKGHYKNSAEAALSVDEVIAKFSGRGALTDAFSFAVQDLESAISKINPEEREKIFKNGKSFMHLEVVYPPSSNVVNYEIPRLIFHSTTEYNAEGDPIGEDKAAASTLTKLIKDVNADVQKNYQIDPPKELQFKKNINYANDRGSFLKELSKIQKVAGIGNEETLGDYITSEYKKLIEGVAEKFKYEIPTNVLDGLIQRFAFADKTFRIPQIKKAITNPKFLQWVLDFEKKKGDYYKKVMEPFENLILRLGVKVISLATSFLAVNPDEQVQTIRKELEKTVKEVRANGSESKLNKLEKELNKLEAIGGFDAVLPSEGIVFQYKGKTYKLTGAFAPVNQILGTIKYAK